MDYSSFSREVKRLTIPYQLNILSEGLDASNVLFVRNSELSKLIHHIDASQ